MAYSNKNFGGSFIFWDKLFGTFCPALPTTPFSYGVSGDRPSANPFWASNLPFLRYFRLAWRPAPGRPRDRRSALSVFSGAMLLFSLVVGYVYQYGYGYGDISWPQMALLVLLALGSVALGGMTEGRPWASAVWLLIALGMPLLFIGYLGWPQRYWHIAMAAVALHALCVALGWGEWPHRPPWRTAWLNHYRRCVSPPMASRRFTAISSARHTPAWRAIIAMPIPRGWPRPRCCWRCASGFMP